MKKFTVEIDGEPVAVIGQKINGKLWLHYNGRTVDYAASSKVQSSSGAQAGVQDPSQLLAPMPGKIVKLNKKVGDSVVAGETIVAMEAMKMEYNLKATQDMKIKSILCRENQIVALGDKLVIMEEISE